MVYQTASIRAHPEFLPQALLFVSGAASGAGLGPDQCRRVQLVIEELFTNTINHAYQRTDLFPEDTENTVWLTIRRSGSGIEIDYQDAGRAFDPTGVAKNHGAPPGMGGIGLVLVNTLPTSMRYLREDDRNRIILRFDR